MAWAVFYATFAHLIINIFLVCAEPQVLWVYAFGIVAVMKNMQPYWYFANKNRVSGAMCSNHFAFKSKLTVTLAIKNSLPLVTFVGCDYFTQKSAVVRAMLCAWGFSLKALPASFARDGFDIVKKALPSIFVVFLHISPLFLLGLLSHVQTRTST
jgi:hypothetical protein